MISNAIKIVAAAALVFVGGLGSARAEGNDHDVVHDERGQIIRATNGTCVRTKWYADDDVCATRKISEHAVSQLTVIEAKKTRLTSEFSREERTVYFDFDRADLSAEALGRLDTLVDALKADKTVRQAHIVGYADRLGSEAYNEKLSQKRANTVYDYIVKKGYANANVTQTRWVGESEPGTDCPAQARSGLISCLQYDRRVEVAIEYVQEKRTSEKR